MSRFSLRTSTGGTAAVDGAEIYRLAARLRGELLLPGDEAYDRKRKVWNGLIDHRPGLIACCMMPADVVEAIRFAREHDLLVSVRGGGHNIAGKAVCDGGVMIDQSQRRKLEVDVGSGTARVEAGATLGELDAATQAAGLATTAGVVTHTGVAGLTLGGGVGRLARKHGLACDNLVSVDVVTADGLTLTASDAENADLFWGMRGAGANFGVATAFTFRLHPVGPVVLGGVVVHGLSDAGAAMHFYSDFSRSAPDELSADAFFLTSPDGDPVFAISVCYIGPVEQGERVLEPLRRFRSPLVHDIAPVAYTEIQAVGDGFFPIGLNYYWKGR
jgi:FAD/FMN-containing dehydrogenase